MSERTLYADIPPEARDALDDLYYPEGAEIWWNAPHRWLHGVSPRDAWQSGDEGQADVRRILDILTSGAFA